MRLVIAYGTGQKLLNLAGEALIVEGKGLPALFDPKFAVTQALRNPVASLPLVGLVNPLRRVVVLLSDTTRPTGAALYLPLLLRELELGGVPDEHITLLVGTGAHGVLSDGELDRLVSPEIRQRYRLLSHDCFDQEDLVKVGTTSRGNDVWLNRLAAEADLRILTGAVSVHPFAGFGGGRKALFPGVAGYETICRNHALLLQPGAQPGQLVGNPVHEDLMEGVAMTGAKFLLNTVVNEAGEIAAVFGGDLERAHAAGVRAVQASAVAEVPRLVDTVIASAGGFPYDINLYQAVKALQNAARIVRPGGRIVLYAECREGVGSSKFAEWAARRLSAQELARQLAEQFELGKHKCFFVSQILEQAEVYLCSSLDPDLVRSFGLIPISDPGEVPVAGDVVVLPRATATLPGVAKA